MRSSPMPIASACNIWPSGLVQSRIGSCVHTSPAHAAGTRCASLFAPILAFAPFKLFVVDSSVEPLKCVSETNRIGSKILIDVSFNQQMAMRTARFRQNTRCGQAGSELIHLRNGEPLTEIAK